MKKLEISEETYEKIKGQLTQEEVKDLTCFDDMIGGKYFFRQVTYHMLGRVVRRLGNFLELETASWIADSGRFSQFIQDGVLNEVEPVGTAYINLDFASDFFPWKHELPTVQK